MRAREREMQLEVHKSLTDAYSVHTSDYNHTVQTKQWVFMKNTV